ncbi:N-acetyl-gamma-glutamyl-phosphate reductase [[Clostridium] symbiosum]|uniref:N-acetyl-gamma-glutamyl-phosphate reductase n=1 Tax=Clostridium symbiosum TaxID=1512 RepID=UPI001D097CD9|nr:N-acetyl-gamma-glutamyl-phosphate reductase [[Clostridium] symbiosum]MCB6608311.1 N-acetyl-gamma-glutamyl-phosphate reductase [[Clostridium] symbiosum]MCB6932861.1 N-acetyl-gamma-glutamyl-phosphate reductase [[Clostridium] symbiosum]
MCKPKVYIDGKEGTTGLQIYDRLADRDDIELLLIDEEKRKDTEERKKLINRADIVFLCLPDAAAVQAVELADSPDTRIIDASTAHRTADGWAYGLPELSPGHRKLVEASKRVANPGCHATGFITAVYPLTAMGIIPAGYPLTAFSLTGYSGGGKKMIAEYESPGKPELYKTPRVYGLNLKHKHLPEMQKLCGLDSPPVFCPVVDDYYKGMAVTVMLQNGMLNGKVTAEEIHAALSTHYAGQKMIKVHPFGYDGMIAAGTMAGFDSLELIVNGHDGQTIITALFDNLGKGASGAAVQNMNLMLGFEETRGLNLKQPD